MTLPLYLVPGLMNDHRVWQHQVDAFAPDRAVRVADAASHDTIGDLATAALANAPADRFVLAASRSAATSPSR